MKLIQFNQHMMLLNDAAYIPSKTDLTTLLEIEEELASCGSKHAIHVDCVAHFLGRASINCSNIAIGSVATTDDRLVEYHIKRISKHLVEIEMLNLNYLTNEQNVNHNIQQQKHQQKVEQRQVIYC